MGVAWQKEAGGGGGGWWRCRLPEGRGGGPAVQLRFSWRIITSSNHFKNEKMQTHKARKNGEGELDGFDESNAVSTPRSCVV